MTSPLVWKVLSQLEQFKLPLVFDLNCYKLILMLFDSHHSCFISDMITVADYGLNGNVPSNLGLMDKLIHLDLRKC